MRVMGKRQIGQLEPVDFVIALMISELATLPMENNRIPLIYAIVPITTLVILQMFTSLFELKSEKFRSLVNGEPNIVIRDGKVDMEELKKLRFHLDDLMEDLRINGYFNLKDIHYAVLESNGEISVMPTKASTPPSAEDLNISVTDEPFPMPIILDGKVNMQNLSLIGKDIKWLTTAFKKYNIEDFNDISIAIVYSKDQKLYFQKK